MYTVTLCIYRFWVDHIDIGYNRKSLEQKTIQFTILLCSYGILVYQIGKF